MLEKHLDMTVREWIQRFQDRIVCRSVKYKGVRTWKNILDLWVYQEIVHDTRPELIVEIGCKFGGTTNWLSDLMKTVGSGEVVAVDITRPSMEFPDNVSFVEGDSVAPEVVEQVRIRAAGKRTMVIADSDHSEGHVLAELRAYHSLVSPGCYFVVEDGIVDVMEWSEFTPGPLPAVKRFIAENDQFTIDEHCEKFILTYNPSGYLKKVA